MKALRHFYRCYDCLTVAVTMELIEPIRDARGNARYAECDACGGGGENHGTGAIVARSLRTHACRNKRIIALTESLRKAAA
jgi:hypothetical protein